MLPSTSGRHCAHRPKQPIHGRPYPLGVPGMLKAGVAPRYTLPVRSLPPGQSQRMKVSMKPPEQDPSGARGHEGLHSVRLQAAALLARLKALAHSGPVDLFLEVRH